MSPYERIPSRPYVLITPDTPLDELEDFLKKNKFVIGTVIVPVIFHSTNKVLRRLPLRLWHHVHNLTRNVLAFENSHGLRPEIRPRSRDTTRLGGMYMFNYYSPPVDGRS